MSEAKDGCVSPAQGPLDEASPNPQGAPPPPPGGTMKVQVGKPAPDFEASAYLDGGFQNLKLSHFRGKWVLLCFYPGDFTFV